MNKELVNFLKKGKWFTSLDDHEFQELLPKLTTVKLNQGDLLFNQNDLSMNVYLVAKGKLSALLMIEEKPEVVGTINVGETVGELGVITKEPRTLTVKATEDSLLIKIKNKDFLALCFAHPAILFETIQPLITRSQTLIQKLTLKNEVKYLSFIPANKTVDAEIFFQKLTGYARRYSSLIIFSDYDPELKKLSALELKNLIKKAKRDKKSSQKMVFFLKSPGSGLAKEGMSKTDMLYLIANNEKEPTIDSRIINFIHKTSTQLKSDPHLIVLQPPHQESPLHTAAWLQLTPFAMHYQVKITKLAHYHRLLRFIRGKAIGLVLGGGGTRGWAHIGVIKALREQRIPIDFIGGTSVGSVIAALYAIHESITLTYDMFSKIVQTSKGSTSWRSFTWPVISIFNAKRFTEAQKEAFNKLQIEDLWLPFFCISSNLATSTEEVHRQGMLWEKIRASTAIPGIIPPMVIKNELHLDGGLFNNLPVDVMRKYVGKKGKVVAVELNNSLRDYYKYDFPPVLTFKTLLFYKLGLTRENFKFPRFIDTFLRGLLVGSSARTKLNGLAADLLINLNLNKFRLLNTNLMHGEKMFEMGKVEATLRIKQMKNNHLE